MQAAQMVGSPPRKWNTFCFVHSYSGTLHFMINCIYGEINIGNSKFSTNIIVPPLSIRPTIPWFSQNCAATNKPACAIESSTN